MAIAGLGRLGMGLLTSGVPARTAGMGLARGAGQAALAAAPFVPSLIQTLGGDPLSGGASAGVTALAGKYGKLAQAATGIGAPMVMPAILGGAGKAAQSVMSGVGDLISGGQERQLERGESPTATGLGTGKEVGDLDAEALTDLARRMGVSQVEVAQALIDPYRQKTAIDVQNQMQLNQQLAQLTGGLNQQKYMAQLAGGAQQEAGATTRTMMTAPNPYAASVFKYS